MGWITLTLIAAFMQAVRTAGQKSLSTTVSPITATMVRYAFGLPFAMLYLWIVAGYLPGYEIQQISFGLRFFVYAIAASFMQILATVFLIQVFSTRNFAVGTAYAKTEAMMTAVLAVLLFAEHLSFSAWVSVIVGVAGVLIISISSGKINLLEHAEWRVAGLGLLSGLCFSLTSLFLRQASLSLEAPAFLTAAITLLFMVGVQTLLTVVWIAIRSPEQFMLLRPLLPICLFVGITSVAGSVGWFTAMTLQNPAYVKALGQIEFILTLVITGRVFKETVSRQEALGMFMIIASVCLLLLGE
ncbi:MAG: DMT family transporter [Granulosicoccus sp.]